MADGLLKLRVNQGRESGLGLLTYLENWNEQDKWWAGRESFFRPFEYAAMTSADWDGHEGALGPTVGIRNADPAARLVMGGVAVAELDYLRAVKLWFDWHRQDTPFAAINLHHYCNDGGGQAGKPTVGISPEADGLKARFAAFADYRNRYLRDSELWVTEFGWDVDARSVQRAPALAGASAEEIQGRWIARAWLELAAAGADRAHQFMMRDVVAPGAKGGGEVQHFRAGRAEGRLDAAPRVVLPGDVAPAPARLAFPRRAGAGGSRPARVSLCRFRGPDAGPRGLERHGHRAHRGGGGAAVAGRDKPRHPCDTHPR
ncbi:MAG: hypothetical protein IPL39_21315 [Opitutaceae bacterium]|nr:hypothetical protein [Opitutaceae bacterium]